MSTRLVVRSSKQPLLSIERVVAILTPTVFAPAAVIITAFVAKHFPGLPHPTPDTIVGLESAAFLGACGLGWKWLHGRQIPAIAQLQGGATDIVSALDQAGLLPVVEKAIIEEVRRVWSTPGAAPPPAPFVASGDVAGPQS